ncbi:helix-turn-helix transcriptional regulator [Dermacoccus sp. PAMC28757]|uniref:helix-turn-helix transcriptional regulator n=1 Tax=Dermacoccus sp. PAMC28757 TaxID=2762331 RepID=UPI00164E041F|nr:helix-turn-helix transcriptional regulator [Dermacoccus sp. PAMC28757]QNK52348.1 helix-turn-helix transcriptional regulator [Dermacoccus sp. PAMC28757]
MSECECRTPGAQTPPSSAAFRDIVASMPATFARNVRRRREAIGVSQGMVAKIMFSYGFRSWRQTTLAKVEAGERAVKLDEAFALAEIYAISLDDLLRDCGVERVDGAIAEDVSKRFHPSRRAG